MKINDLVQNLFNSARRKAGVIVLGAGLALGAGACGDTIINNYNESEDVSESDSGNGVEKVPTYEGICEDHQEYLEMDPTSSKLTTEEIQGWYKTCQNCEPENYNEFIDTTPDPYIGKKLCTEIYCATTSEYYEKNDNPTSLEEYSKCYDDFGVENH